MFAGTPRLRCETSVSDPRGGFAPCRREATMTLRWRESGRETCLCAYHATLRLESSAFAELRIEPRTT